MSVRKEMQEFCACLCRQDELYTVLARRSGISYNAAMVLYALDTAEGCTQGDIARTWLIPKQTVNTVVKELERQGHVRLECGRDMKEKRVFFTETGREYAAGVLREIYALEERAVEVVGRENFRRMVEINRAFTEAFAQEVSRG